MGKRISRTVLGLCIAAVGIGYLGNQFSWWHFDLFFEGWCPAGKLKAVGDLLDSQGCAWESSDPTEEEYP